MINFPNAKINIGLNIINKRTDGFHNIESVFYPIAWKDALEVIPSSDFSFSHSGLSIPGESNNNLIIKAYKLIKPFIKKETEVKIHLHKLIPMGAGLGGGSADAAFALKLFNSVLNLTLSDEQLINLSAELGSDCPFFIKNRGVFAYDRGIQFKPIKLDLSKYYILVVNPKIHISTKEAYESLSPKIPASGLLENINRPIEEWVNLIKNDFENPLSKKYPVIKTIKERLYQLGAIYSSMTGSGSTVYGIFDHQIETTKQFSEYVVWKGKMM